MRSTPVPQHTSAHLSTRQRRCIRTMQQLVVAVCQCVDTPCNSKWCGVQEGQGACCPDMQYTHSLCHWADSRPGSWLQGVSSIQAEALCTAWWPHLLLRVS